MCRISTPLCEVLQGTSIKEQEHRLGNVDMTSSAEENWDEGEYLTSEEKYLTALLAELMPGNAVVMECVPPPGQHGCDHRNCYCSCWQPNAPRRGCLYHGTRSRTTLHDTVGRAAVGLVYSVDPDAFILPEFSILDDSGRSVRGRFAIVRYVVDLLVVTSTGRVIAFEFNGKSHDAKKQRKRDKCKAQKLVNCQVERCTVSIRCENDEGDPEIVARALQHIHGVLVPC